MSGKGVLLLGGRGFIGSALATRMEQEQLPTFLVGRSNMEQLEQLLPDCGTVVHLASSTTPASSAEQPDLELANIELTLRLLKLLQPHPQIHLIFFSSGGTVYGNPRRLPVPEDCPLTPLSYHGAGKVAQEVYFSTARAKRSISILRPSNVYGPGQSIRQGFGLVRTMLDHARRGTTLEIWGDGQNVRDYIYIDDVVDATLRLIERPRDSDTYNLGSGVGYSINDVKSLVEEVCGKPIKTKYLPARGMDVRRVVLDNRRITAALDWAPRVDLKTGVARTWQWMCQHAK